ncbi:MAG: type II CAAX endopeptidase family protein [Gammaproteobacteria bacterium]
MTAVSPVHRGPWNPGQTLAWGIAVGVVFMLIQVGVAWMFYAVETVQHPGLDSDEFSRRLGSNGLFLAVSTWATALICTPIVYLLARARGADFVRDYLGLHGVKWRHLAMWVVILALFAAAWDLLASELGRPQVPDFMIDTYSTAGSLPLFWLALVIAAPAFEELFFRGFLLEGLRHMSPGPVGAVIFTAGLWAAIHVQYDLFDITTIFLFGLILSAARLKAGSVLLPFIMHALLNLVATVQTAIFMD